MLKLTSCWLSLWRMFCLFIESILYYALDAYVTIILSVIACALIGMVYKTYVFVQKGNNGIVLLGILLSLSLLWFLIAQSNFNKRLMGFRSGIKPNTQNPS